MITILHGGQTGVDRGAHEGARDNGWSITGCMPQNRRDELGRIPEAIAQCLESHNQPGLAARTEVNVRRAAAVLIVARDANDPRATPGTAKTLDLAACCQLPRLIVDPATNPDTIARWIWNSLLDPNRPPRWLWSMLGTLPLPLEPRVPPPREASPVSTPPKLLIAGPRESKWQGARVETAALLRRVAIVLTKVSQVHEAPRPGIESTVK